ncbi:MAG: gamma-glutamyltransferase family protein [Desulforhopalus sp.]
MSDEKVYSEYEQTRTSYRPAIRGRKQMVVSGHNLATQAAMRILDKGGNSIDAGVAAGLCLAVLQSDMVNFAGVAPMMLHIAGTGLTTTIDGLGVWPKKASVAFFKDNHGGRIPDGIHRCIVPGAPDAWLTALRKYGTMSFAEISADACDLAENGFPMHQFMRNSLHELKNKYARWPSNRDIYQPHGRPPEVDEIFYQKDLGKTIRRMIHAERDALLQADRSAGILAARDEFYKGSIARDIVTFNTENNGLMQAGDLAHYSCTEEEPFCVTFREYTVKGAGPWCQGPVLLQTLNILEHFDLEKMGHNSGEYIHTIGEALKIAFADREKFYGDPGFETVPISGLLSKEYAGKCAGRIQKTSCPGMPEFGNPWEFNNTPMPQDYDMLYNTVQPNREQNDNLDTSYICVVDKDGNCLSAVPSDMSFSGPVIPGTGIVVSTRGSQSFVDEKHASSVEGGKRPRLTPAPFMIFKNDKPWMIIGTPGGDTQCQTILQTFFNVVLFGMEVQTAVEQPRFATFSYPNSFAPHDYHPNVLRVEKRVGAPVISELEKRGHKVITWPDWAWKAGGACAIIINENVKTLVAGADPRRESYAQGW